MGFCGEICRNGNRRVWNSHRAGICLCVTVTQFMLSSSSLSPSHSLRELSSCRGTLCLTPGRAERNLIDWDAPDQEFIHSSCGMLNPAVALRRISPSLRQIKKKKRWGVLRGKLSLPVKAAPLFFVVPLRTVI